jgi:aspartyl-tRNA synthetase
MYRTHHCGVLRIEDENQEVMLAGWVQRSRDLGGMTFVDLRDRYGITQLVFNMEINAELCQQARKLHREDVIQAKGKVVKRSSVNKELPTGDIEIEVNSLEVLNQSILPPFTIEDETDGGEELRMKYRYLDLRRKPNLENIKLRHRIGIEIRNFLHKMDFLEIETPFLIKSTPEGARDYVVPSRIHPGEFYALPQSPQTFKQLLMVAGYDKYFQIVKCFRDEDLRADRQPEFTQIDCEMSFVERDDVLMVFESMIKYLFKQEKGIELGDFPKLSFDDAMRLYGSDKPDLRFEMQFIELNELTQNNGFAVFDDAELVVGICAEACADYSRKQLDALTDFVRKPQIGAKGLVYIKYNTDGSFKSSVDKFFSQEDLKAIAEKMNAKSGDLILILAGDKKPTRKALCELRLKMGKDLGLLKKSNYTALWVVDFPLLEWDEEEKRFFAMHHPFTSPVKEDIEKLKDNAAAVRANAYDLVINGVEIGGGSIRIHDKELQKQVFDALGFSEEEAEKQFGFLLNAFEYGAPPHGGIAFGFDRLCAMFGDSDSIRDYIAFPKNNAARDVMIASPSIIDQKQLEELHLNIKIKAEEKKD